MGLAKNLYMEAAYPSYVTSGTYKCPHGYDVEYEDDETPGFRDHYYYNPCPYCNWDKNPFLVIQEAANKHNARKVTGHGQTLELKYQRWSPNKKELTPVDVYNLNENMFKKMRKDEAQFTWFKEHGVCDGEWTEEMNARWWKWVSDSWLCRGDE